MQPQECHHLNPQTAVSRSIDQKVRNGFMTKIGISVRFCGCCIASVVVSLFLTVLPLP